MKRLYINLSAAKEIANLCLNVTGIPQATAMIKMKKNPNTKRFPHNMQEPKKSRHTRFTVYNANFNGLNDLYKYLKSKPTINREIFQMCSSSLGGTKFAGAPYFVALEELVKPPRDGYGDFLKLAESLEDDALDYVEEYTNIKSVGGGAVDIPSYVAGNPLCYRSSRKIEEPKFVRINIDLGYAYHTTKEQVLHRAIIIAALVNAFEKAGYMVSIDTFELAQKYEELVRINVNIKNGQESFNKAALFKTLCHVEFLRRVLFRVLETMNLKHKAWQEDYGEVVEEDDSRDVLGLTENDLYIRQPCEMGIEGYDIVDDFKSVIRRLNIDDKVDVGRFKENLREDARRLEKTIR